MHKDMVIVAHGKSMDFRTPRVMGILNITPDSFYDGGKYFGTTRAMEHALLMISQGADIIDIGGQSTRPGSTRISESEELERIEDIITSLRNYHKDIWISVDTYHSKVAQKAYSLGADIVNDVSGGDMDSDMIEIIAAQNIPYVLMHMQGNPENMQDNPQYDHVTREVYEILEQKVKSAQSRGAQQIIIDPGFGFGKNIQQNYQLLRELDHFHSLECPILVGISRKSMIYKLLNITPQESLSATSALHLYALEKGAHILRVHDVLEAKQTITLFNELKWTTQSKS